MSFLTWDWILDLLLKCRRWHINYGWLSDVLHLAVYQSGSWVSGYAYDWIKEGELWFWPWVSLWQIRSTIITPIFYLCQNKICLHSWNRQPRKQGVMQWQSPALYLIELRLFTSLTAKSTNGLRKTLNINEPIYFWMIW